MPLRDSQLAAARCLLQDAADIAGMSRELAGRASSALSHAAITTTWGMTRQLDICTRRIYQSCASATLTGYDDAKSGLGRDFLARAEVSALQRKDIMLVYSLASKKSRSRFQFSRHFRLYISFLLAGFANRRAIRRLPRGMPVYLRRQTPARFADLPIIHFSSAFLDAYISLRPPSSFFASLTASAARQAERYFAPHDEEASQLAAHGQLGRRDAHIIGQYTLQLFIYLPLVEMPLPYSID